jgi:hypothetical protein
MNCPNYSHPTAKLLLKELGKEKTLEIYLENNFSFPEDIQPYLNNTLKTNKPGVEELFDSNPELANAVYEALRYDSNEFSLVLKQEEENQEGIMLGEYDIVYKNNSIGNVLLPLGYKNYTIKGIVFKEQYLNKGLGKAFYKWLGNKADIENATLNSDFDNTSESAKRVWESLKKENLAVDAQMGYKFSPKNLKQQALQLYSQYLDTIFPDSKVKDIVYHGSNQKINQFEIRKEPLIHFGSKNAALQRGGVLNQVLLNVKDLQTIKDGMWFLGTNEGGLLKELLDRNILTIEQVKSINETKNKAIQQSPYFNENYRMALPEGEKAGNKKLQEILANKNIGFEYVNFSEDKSSTSFAVPSEEQIHILGGKQDIKGFKKFVGKNTYNLDTKLPNIELPTGISFMAAKNSVLRLAEKYKDYVFSYIENVKYGNYDIKAEPKQKSVTTDIIEKMINKFGGTVRYINKDDLWKYNAKENSNSFVTTENGKTVIYLVNGRVNDVIAIEEFLHPFVAEIEKNNPQLFADLLSDANGLNEFKNLIENIKREYSKIPGYNIDNEIVTQILSQNVLKNFVKNSGEVPQSLLDNFIKNVNKVFSEIAQNIANLIKEMGFNKKVQVSALSRFSTIRSMSALLNMEGLEFETAQIDQMYNLSSAQTQSIEMFDELEKKKSLEEDTHTYSILGFDIKWKTPSQLSKNKKFGEDIKDEEGEQMKNVGTKFHSFMEDIITKAFPAANTHRSNIVINEEDDVYYERLKNYLDPIIEKAKSEGAVLRAETFVANENLKIAGTIDLLKINQDGSYEVYDLKTRYRKEISGTKRYNKIFEWSSQLGYYKQLLSDKNTVGVPINTVKSVKVIELEASQYEGKIKKIKGIGLVAPKFEKTNIEKLDDFISKLYNQIEVLKNKKGLNTDQKIINEKLLESKLALAQDLQIKGDQAKIISQAYSEIYTLENLIESDNVENNSQTILTDLNIYSVLSKFIDESVLTQEEVNQLYYIQGKAISLKTKFLDKQAVKIKEQSTRVGVLGKLTNDLFGAVKDVSQVLKFISGAATLDSPLVATAYRLINERTDKAKESSAEAYKTIKNITDKLKEFQSGKLDYSVFINKSNGKNYLVDKFSSEYYRLAKIAKNKADSQWFIENSTFDKEKYLKNYDNQIKYLDRFKNSKLKELKDLAISKNIENVDAYVNKSYNLYRKEFLSKWVNANNTIMNYNIPKDIWIDSKWKDIKEGKYKGTPVEEFYDLYKRFLAESNDIAPDYVGDRFIPNFSASFVEKVSQMGVLGSLSQSWSNLLTDLDTSYDLNYGLKDADTGKTIHSLSIPGIGNKVENQSLDLGLTMMMFMEGVYKYKELSEIEETVQLARHFVRTGKILKTDIKGNISEISAINSNMADSFDGYIDAVLYGVKKGDAGSTKIVGGEGVGGKIGTMAGLIKEGDEVMLSWARVVDKLLKYVSLKNLSFNVFSPITNLLAGTAQLYATGHGGKYYNKENMNESITVVTGGDTTEEGKLANKIFEWLEINGKEVKFRNNNLSAYQTDKMLEKFNGMTAMRISEELLQKASVLAMLKSEKHRLKMSDFKLNSKGELEIVNSDVLNKSLFKAKAIRVTQMSFGAINEDDYILANKSIIGRMLIQHRTWIPQMLMARFANKRYDYVLEEELEGRYKVLSRLLLNFNSKIIQGTATEDEKYAAKAASMELGIWTGIGMLLMAMSAGFDDDDKKEAWYKFSNLVGQRIFAELGFFVPLNVSAQSQILLHPAASISLIDDYGRLTKNIWKEVTGDEKEQKSAKPLKSLGKVVPYIGQLQRFIDEMFNINLSNEEKK